MQQRKELIDCDDVLDLQGKLCSSFRNQIYRWQAEPGRALFILCEKAGYPACQPID
jgi:hypothetical protein